MKTHSSSLIVPKVCFTCGLASQSTTNAMLGWNANKFSYVRVILTTVQNPVGTYS